MIKVKLTVVPSFVEKGMFYVKAISDYDIYEKKVRAKSLSRCTYWMQKFFTVYNANCYGKKAVFI